MKKILYVEKSDLFKRILEDIFTVENYEIIKAETIQEAFDVLASMTIDFIITELELGNVNAKEFLIQLNTTQYKRIPVFLLSSNNSIEVKHSFFKLGIVDYILKQDLENEEKIEYFKNLLKHDNGYRDLHNLSIAVLDDSKLSLKVISRIFHMNNILNVDYYSRGEELLSSDQQYDIYLLDLVMPKMSGREMVMHIRSQKENSVIILISSIDNEKTISNILNYGADDYIIKPFSPIILMSRMATNARLYTLNNRLRELLKIDGLTKILNHKSIIEYLKNQISSKIPQMIAMYDIDDFKKINDSYGHVSGDRVLIKIASIINETIGSYGEVGRYGGEEFLVVLNNVSMEEGKAICENIIKDVRNAKYMGISDKVTISGGAIHISKASSITYIVKEADEALYKAKKNGKDCLVINS